MIIWKNLTAKQQQALLERPAIAENEQLSSQVAGILTQVKTQGDQALFSLTEKFDGIALSSLQVTPAQIDQAKKALDSERLTAINTAYEQIKSFHQAQQPQDVIVETRPGVVCTLTSQAIESVGLYIPAGSAPLPSTVLMLGVPAQLANCERKVLVCPPDRDGKLADEVLVAADLCNIDEIYTLGGAQAIAALAYGTQSIKPVCKVFGPGNRFVTEAKKQLSQQVPGFAIDMPAGPSEVLVIADKNSNPEFVAADLLSQAEHGPDSQVVLVSDSESLIAQVEQAMAQQLSQLSRRDIATQALTQSRLILTDNLATAVQVSNQYAPEHLIIQTETPRAQLAGIRNAGSVFLGAYTPESAGDYASGTNHVLPTYGYAKVCSSLSLADFYRRFTIQEITKAGLASLAPCITELTDAEGLDGHKRAVTIRLAQNKAQNSEQNKAQGEGL
ncbi:histidinol dehydrogenase [Thalassomonas actiniarum]|uniref:Histidinol dehydrogenase n=1 Tax=Thalassomonas actiniarum TaxID=485447 RepID=A0AAE9YUZ4_9GAMM|nr:histidinol dehydrogenase [Thalassomonas actiniarum]WDE00904.1 histidinol dehydrogenase [Thalassomonas actiniarum]